MSAVDPIIVDACDVPRADEIDITFQVAVKHADLLKAARKCGSSKKLAEHLGVSMTTISQWICLKSAPNFDSPQSRARIDWDTIGTKLFVLTGKTLEEMWPESVRSSDFLDMPKKAETTVAMEARDLAIRYEQFRHLEQPSETIIAEELTETLQRFMKMLPERQQRVLKMRYGIDGPVCDLIQCGKAIGVTKERVRQIEAAALLKLRDLAARDKEAMEVFTEER